MLPARLMCYYPRGVVPAAVTLFVFVKQKIPWWEAAWGGGLIGFAVLTHHVWAGIVPLIMGLNFVLILIPAHDAYLASRYGTEFDDYARRTKKLIRLVY